MKLFTVGPVEMFPDTLEESALQLPYFRTPEFSAIMLETEKMLLDLAGAPSGSRAIFLTASGTGAMEAAVLNCLDNNDHVLTIDGGSFGHRFVQLCDAHQVKQTVLTLEFGKTLTREMLESCYANDMTALLVNLHETSIGQLYDINMLSDFCQNHDLLFIVDAISAFIADPIDVEKNHVDVMILSSQKALSLAPGISTVILSPRAVRLSQERGTNVMYFDFRDYLKNGERGQTPFTPAVGILLTLHKRLKIIQAEGLENVQSSVRNLAEDFRERIAQLPVEIPNYPHSYAMTPVYFPEGNAKTVYEILRTKYEITVNPTGGPQSDYILRVGHIGHLSLSDNTELVCAIQDILEQIKA